jgi:hypothetical protein
MCPNILREQQESTAPQEELGLLEPPETKERGGSRALEDHQGQQVHKVPWEQLDQMEMMVRMANLATPGHLGMMDLLGTLYVCCHAWCHALHASTTCTRV